MKHCAAEVVLALFAVSQCLKIKEFSCWQFWTEKNFDDTEKLKTKNFFSFHANCDRNGNESLPSTPSPVSPRAKCQTDVSLSRVSSLHIFHSLQSLHSNKTKKCNLFYCQDAIYANRFFDASNTNGLNSIKIEDFFDEKKSKFGVFF